MSKQSFSRRLSPAASLRVQSLFAFGVLAFSSILPWPDSVLAAGPTSKPEPPATSITKPERDSIAAAVADVVKALPSVPEEVTKNDGTTPIAETDRPLVDGEDAFTTPPPFKVPQPPVLGNSKWAISQRLDLQRFKLPLPFPQPRVVVYKAQRRLELWNGNQQVKTYRVSLGGNPIGAKQKQHDSRTPEGHFKIVTRNSVTSAFHIFLGLSYPDIPDAQRGLKTGLINQREYQMIRNRLASRGAPLWETRLGGWVGIHGGTNGTYAQEQMRTRGTADWTAGCIALTDSEIEEIHAATKMGTPVWVRP